MRRMILVSSWLLATPLTGQGTVVSYALGAVAPRTWSVGLEPLLEIGGTDGRGPTEFQKVVGVSRLSDGRIVVANASTAEIRLFSSSGQFVRALTRRGDGPDELRGINLFHVLGDTLVAIELGTFQTVHVGVGPDYSFARHRSTVEGYMGPALGALSATTVLLRLNKGTVKDIANMRRDSQWIARRDARDSSVHFHGTHPQQAMYALPGGLPTYPLGFAPDLEVAVASGRYCLGIAERYEFSCRLADGRAQFTVRRATKTIPVAESARRLFRNALMGIKDDGSSRFEGSLLEHRRSVAKAAQFATHYPAYGRLLLAKTGDVWVKTYVPYDDGISTPEGSAPEKPTLWSIFDGTGRWIADCTLPARFTLMEVGVDYVIGTSRDDDDVERVTLWPLRR